MGSSGEYVEVGPIVQILRRDMIAALATQKEHPTRCGLARQEQDDARVEVLAAEVELLSFKQKRINVRL
jgi:hypothetical protein